MICNASDRPATLLESIRTAEIFSLLSLRMHLCEKLWETFFASVLLTTPLTLHFSASWALQLGSQTPKNALFEGVGNWHYWIIQRFTTGSFSRAAISESSFSWMASWIISSTTSLALLLSSTLEVILCFSNFFFSSDYALFMRFP